MNSILQGTTPDFIIKIKTEDFVVSDVTKLEVTIWNGTRQSIYGLEAYKTATNWSTYASHIQEEPA